MNKNKRVKTEIYFAQISNTLKIPHRYGNNYVHHIKLSSGIKKLIQITVLLQKNCTVPLFAMKNLSLIQHLEHYLKTVKFHATSYTNVE